MVGSRYLYTYLDMYRLLKNIPGNNKNCTVPRSPFQKKKSTLAFILVDINHNFVTLWDVTSHNLASQVPNKLI